MTTTTTIALNIIKKKYFDFRGPTAQACCSWGNEIFNICLLWQRVVAI